MKQYKLDKQARTFMPEIMAPGTGLSPATQRSVVPTNNVHTIQDVLDGRKYSLPGGGGDWSEGEDVEKNYKDTGDDYKRKARDLDIIKNITDPMNMQDGEQWKVKIPGGSRVFPSFPAAQKYLMKMREKGISVKWISRIAQQSLDKVQVVSGSMKRTFKIESVDTYHSIKDTGASFCVAENHFVTCAHCIVNYNRNVESDIEVEDLADRVEVFLIQNGRRVPAQVIAINCDWDIAIIKAEVDVEPFELDVGSMQIGDDILTIGSPHGFENNVSFGNISSIGKDIYSHQGAPKCFFVDAPVFQGNSGGPIIKVFTGEVVGMLTSIVAQNGEYGLNVGLPSNYLRNFCIMNNVNSF